MCRGDEQHHPHVSDRSFAMDERLEAEREDYRRPPAKPLVRDAAAPREEQQCG